ncbi:TerB family tellurite resistance protein [Nereida sp. MMG025]|uniref:tellurite resistance TerB family protein n=1 Tax=Nereida sp. MMG025 TaxID=2909981 RepID=UPI001F1F7A7B|nr:TerB family tellurite resistance protein [Nereida sp. MMG025]MCF6443830.1 TerB family tellurite resistance protein [Nereida sp. MMG025]
MFERITALWTADAPKPLAEMDAKHALGALLVRVAKADGTYRASEIAMIDKLLALRFDINVVEAAKLRAECEALEKAMPETEAVEEVLRSVTSLQDRQAFLGDLREVILADGSEDSREHEIYVDMRDRLDTSE